MISIIVPVYNNLLYLERCVDSLLAQTDQAIEILLVDDGSTDGTAELCDRMAQRDERIRVLHKENGGTSDARNVGITNARGEYFAFVDSDDTIEPDMMEKLRTAMERSGKSIVQIGRDELDENGHSLAGICEIPNEDIFYTAKDFMRELLLHKGDCSFCTKLVKRELFEGRFFPKGELNEDFYLLTQMLCEAEGVLSLPYCGYHVFYCMGSNTRKKNENDFSRVFTDNVVNADRVMDMVKEHFPELTEIALRFGLVQRLDYLLHIPVAQMTSDNTMYMEIVAYVRKHKKDIQTNPYLSAKNRSYLLLLRMAPKKIRQLHRLSMKLRGKL